MKLFVSLLTITALTLSWIQPAVAKEEKSKKQKGSKKDSKEQQGARKFDPPIPIGHVAEVLTIPYYDEHGKLQMNFKIQLAKRTDVDHLEMKEAKIETFDDKGQQEMSIEMPSSVLDLNTRVVTSQVPVTIRRTDFEVTGETMQFNTETRSGRMLGKVRMLIYNKDQMSKSNATSNANANVTHE